MKVLPEKIWTLRVHQHASAVGPFANAFIKRRSMGFKQPVHDFLFTYYPFSPTKLKQWVPSYEESLSLSSVILEHYPWLKSDWFYNEKKIISLDRTRISKSFFGLVAFIEELSTKILERPLRLSCFGLHEWAMVYKSSPEEIRHSGYCLRLSPENLAKFVDSQRICCSHYDAYRFFTSQAHSLNVLNPTLQNRLQMEQGGCLHANMDLYKWATKLWPWIGSDFIAKTFFLALENRELDMRASPYDLSDDGYAPIPIETEEGRREYQQRQQLLAERAMPLRQELLAFCQRFQKEIKDLFF